MKKVLFVCAQNAGRSQMAAAFFNTLAAGTDWVAESAGTMPADEVDPTVVAVLAERGVDISRAQPRMFAAEKIGDYDRVISFGCLTKEAFSPAVQDSIEDWLMDDPHGKTIEEVREIRDVVEERVRNLAALLAAAH